jgi:hypothetical protein
MQITDAWLPQSTGTTQLLDLLVTNPGHPAFLAILDSTVDAAAMPVRDYDAVPPRRPAMAHPSSRLVYLPRGL